MEEPLRSSMDNNRLGEITSRHDCQHQSSNEMLDYDNDDRMNIMVSTEEDDGMNCCGDDVFSSFLNSLINEDMFNCQNQQIINAKLYLNCKKKLLHFHLSFSIKINILGGLSWM
ncbi:hypothetical protein K7X08_025894 [Anisodus acutangulus]|uniref:Uncharacterized protein n=1 Tax=Anisodus acutangulus TaxID=402998 RepID=A0A9Q1N7I2_9SOLA|nr:hypothetical protein K7X08_025894 [Anisodus acutangulus]